MYIYLLFKDNVFFDASTKKYGVVYQNKDIIINDSSVKVLRFRETDNTTVDITDQIREEIKNGC